MELTIQWQDIKGGYHGFEQLALLFVKEKFPNAFWRKTKKTRDGNKDAVALVFGYQPYPDKAEQWWMEAKYSLESQIINRYRLDATIVSAILEGNVSKVIFVTNILVGSKTIIDIRTALYNAIKCQDVLFCSKYTLEHWLAENPHKYKELFNVPYDYDDISIKQTKLCVTQELEYFTVTGARTAFKEPLRELHKGNTYIAYFSVFSPVEVILPLKKGKQFKGLSIVSNKQIKLLPGENQVNFCFRIEPHYNSIKEKKEIPPPTFLLGDTTLLPSGKIFIMEKVASILHIETQQKIIGQLKQYAKKFIRISQCQYHSLPGISGVGKSFILEQFISDEQLVGEDIFLGKFTGSDAKNNDLMIDLILFILFPYVNPYQVDAEYLKNLNNGYITNHVIDIINSRGDFEKSSSIMLQLDGNSVFPSSGISINRRFLLFDDLHKLNDVSSRFLISLLSDIWERKIPIFAILSSQIPFFKNIAFQWLAEHCVIIRHECIISIRDISCCFSVFFDDNFKSRSNIISIIDLDIIELLTFSRYIMEEDHSIKNIEELMLKFKMFQNGRVKEEYLLSKFKNLFKEHSECRILCDKIYWSCEPYKPLQDEDFHNANRIIEAGIISYNDDGCLMPKHDIYTTHYRKHFIIKSFDELGYSRESPEYVKYSIENEFHPEKLSHSINTVWKLVSERKFHSVLYILQDAFSRSVKIELSRKLDEERYYSLFLAYALAAHQQSLSINCIDLLNELVNETCTGKSAKLREICIHAIWDLALAYYEQLEYTKSREALMEMLRQMRNIQKIGPYPQDIRKILHYHDVITADTLIRINQNNIFSHKLFLCRYNRMRKHGFIYRSLSYGIRYALALCTVEMPLCLSLLNDCGNEILEKYGNKDKHYYWFGFHYNYYSMIWEKKPKLINEVLDYHEMMKQHHYNNYRHRLNAIALYYYYIGNVSDGDRYILKESIFDRELYNRQKAFHYSTFALRELLHENLKDATEYLYKSEKLLRPLESYRKIIKHNITMLNKKHFSSSNIKYWFGGELDENVYYLDPRSSW